MPIITVIDRNKTLEAAPGANLMQAIDESGVIIMHACGGNAICGTCNLEIVECEHALPAPEFAEAEVLRKLKRKGPNVRLSCQLCINGNMTVRLAAAKPAH